MWQSTWAPLPTYLRTLSPNLSKPSSEGRFDFEPTTGALTPISPSTEGRRLDVDETIRRLEAAVFDPVNRRVVMYFETLQPRYPAGISAAELGITQQVAESTTYYWGSWQNRRSNIALGAGKLHGVIIAPGEEFSFNQHLGEITPEAGYLEGSVILGGATVTGIGGGICQVSTTMFRAAFSGGYAITERNSHGYRVGYYEYAGAGPGLDAAIWQPEVDLRFQNNTPYHLLIESSFLGAKDALQFRIYSTPHWRTKLKRLSSVMSCPRRSRPLSRRPTWHWGRCGKSITQPMARTSLSIAMSTTTQAIWSSGTSYSRIIRPGKRCLRWRRATRACKRTTKKRRKTTASRRSGVAG